MRIGTPLGQFSSSATSYIRGGIGEFRSLIIAVSSHRRHRSRPDSPTRVALSPASVQRRRPRLVIVRFSARQLPTDCRRDGQPSFADAAPGVQLFDRPYTAPRSWRGNLSYASSFRQLRVRARRDLFAQPQSAGTHGSQFLRTSRASRRTKVVPYSRTLRASCRQLAPYRRGRAHSSAFGHVIDNVSTCRPSAGS